MHTQATEVVDIKAGSKAQEFLFSKSLFRLGFLSLSLSTIEIDTIMNKLLGFNLQGSCQKLCDRPDTPDFSNQTRVSPLWAAWEQLGVKPQNKINAYRIYFFLLHAEKQNYSPKSVITTSHFQEYSKEILYEVGGGGERTSLERGVMIKEKED